MGGLGAAVEQAGDHRFLGQAVGAGHETQAGLEQAQTAALAVDVALGGAQQARHQAGAHHAQVGGDRVEQRQRRVVRVHLGLQLRGHEAVGDGFHIAPVAQGVAQAAQRQLFFRSGVAGGGAGGHAAGQILVAVHAGQFLDQVFLDRHVEAPAGGAHRPLAGAGFGDRHAQALENVDDVSLVQGRAQQAGHALGAQLDGGGFGQLVLGQGFVQRAGFAAGDLQDQRGGALQGALLQRRIDAALIAVRGVGVQAVAARPAGDRQRAEEGALQEQVAGLFGHRAGAAAHDTGQGQGAVVVGDQQGVVVQLQGLVVQALQGLAGLGPAHANAAGQFGQVKGVQRLAQFQQHIVGHVDDRVDGAHAGAAQALHHPQRRLGGGVDAADHPAQVTRAAVAVVQGHREAVVQGGGHRLDGGLVERGAVEHAHFPGDAAQAQAVGPVGGQVHFDDGVVQGQVVTDVGAQRGVVRQFQQAVDAVLQAQLGAAAQHALGGLAAQLGFLDLQVAGQQGADPGERRLQAFAGVGGAAHHREGALAVTHFTDAQLVGVRVRLAADDLPHHHTGERRCRRLHGVHFQAGHGQLVGQGVAIDVRVDPFPQPGFIETHSL